MAVVPSPRHADDVWRMLHPLHGNGTHLGALGKAFEERMRGCRLRALTALKAGFLASLGRRELPRAVRRAWRLSVVYLMLYAYRGHNADANPFMPFLLAVAFIDDDDDIHYSSEPHGPGDAGYADSDSDDSSDYRDDHRQPMPERPSASERAAKREARRREKELEEKEWEERQERYETVADDKDKRFEHAARLLIFASFAGSSSHSSTTPMRSEGSGTDGTRAKRRVRKRASIPDAVSRVRIEVDIDVALRAAVPYAATSPKTADAHHPVDGLASMLDMLEGDDGPKLITLRRALEAEKDEIRYYLRHRYRLEQEDFEEDELDEGEVEDNYTLSGVSERIVRDVLLSPGYYINGWRFHEERRERKLERQILGILDNATKTPLIPSVQHYVVEHLLERQSLLMRSPLVDASSFPELVEHNSTIATAVLIVYHNLESSGDVSPASGGFSAMLRMLVRGRNALLHSMEVVNRVFMSSSPPALPTEFLDAYIIAIVENTAAINDASMRHRFVRLICIFLNSIIRHAALCTNGGLTGSDDDAPAAAALATAFGEGETAAEVLSVIAAFCIEHSRVKEAADLFKSFASL